MLTATEFAAALRRVADFYDEHPDLPTPYDSSIAVSADDTKEEALRIADLLKPCAKEWSETLLTLSRDFGGLRLRFLFYRSAVCERRVIGTKEVPAQFTPARTEEVVEWTCLPLLSEHENA